MRRILANQKVKNILYNNNNNNDNYNDNYTHNGIFLMS